MVSGAEWRASDLGHSPEGNWCSGWCPSLNIWPEAFRWQRPESNSRTILLTYYTYSVPEWHWIRERHQVVKPAETRGPHSVQMPFLWQSLHLGQLTLPPFCFIDVFPTNPNHFLSFYSHKKLDVLNLKWYRIWCHWMSSHQPSAFTGLKQAAEVGLHFLMRYCTTVSAFTGGT